MTRLELRVAFLNCHSLYEPGTHSRRSPRTRADLQDKIDGLGRTLRSVFDPETPDLVGLCEVSDLALGRHVGSAISSGTYADVWSGDPPTHPGIGLNTSLMILYDRRRVLTTGRARETSRGTLLARKKWLAAQFQLVGGSGVPFWFVVTHWGSDFRRGRQGGNNARMGSSCEMGAFLRDRGIIRDAPVVMVGDFNCEPSDAPLYRRHYGGQFRDQLRGMRERPLVLRPKNMLPYLYNPMWHYMAEPDLWPTGSAPGYARPRPIGTWLHTSVGWHLWDQVLVSRLCLLGGPLTLVEHSIRIIEPVNQCTDHSAVGAVFEY